LRRSIPVSLFTAYDRLKARSDPKSRLSDLHRKCVLRE